MSSRGTANVLTRTTAILAGGFFATSLILSIIASHDRKPSSIIQAPAQQGTPGAPPPLGQGGGLLDQLQGGPGQQPGAPPAPSGPQVPRSQ
jgi:preprotein translocase subunit SecG